MITSSLRITRFAAQNFWRNFWLALITISMLVLTLLTVNILLVINLVTDKAIDYVENRIEVSVYLNEGVVDKKAADIGGDLRNLSQVKDVQIVTSDEVLERFRERHSDDKEILASVDEVGNNPFGPTLVITANSVNDFPFILEALDGPQYRDDIREKDFTDYEQIIQRIQTTTNRVRAAGLLIAGIFLLIAMMIVFNTVRMGIFIHREEITIMKLVGASNWFIRAPFILEVIFYAFVANLMVAAIVLPTIAVLDPQFSEYFGGPVGLITYFELNAWMVFGIQFLLLSFVSIIATAIAMRRYLRV